jgi:hypothetical protein
MNQTSGLSAWRWLFLLEGLPSILSAVAVFFFLPDYPESAKWLSPEEKQLAASRLSVEGSHGHSASMTWAEAKATLLDVRLYAHYAVSLHTRFYLGGQCADRTQIYFGISTPFSSLSLFTPTITAGLGYSGLRAQLMTVSLSMRTQCPDEMLTCGPGTAICSSICSHDSCLLVG